jgi:DMSO reductase anchor subunit
MLLTLPLILFIVMTELSIGAFTVLYLLDWRNQVKRSFLVTYAIIFLILTGLTVLVQQNFSTPELLNTFALLDKAWTGYLPLPLLLFLLLMLPYTILLWLDKKAGVEGKKKAEEEEGEGTRRSSLRLLRLVSGGLAVLAGLVTLFVLGMIFRPLATSGLAGAIIVGSFFASALALGGVLTAMWLGHWYLVTPALSEKPLQFATTLVLVGVLVQLAFTFTGGSAIAASQSSNTAKPAVTATATSAVSAATPAPRAQVKPTDAPVVTPLSTNAISWLRIVVAFVLPLVLLGFILKLIHDRSFQPATGMLYLVVVLTIAGEIMARGLFLMGLQ